MMIVVLALETYLILRRNLDEAKDDRNENYSECHAVDTLKNIRRMNSFESKVVFIGGKDGEKTSMG